MKKLVFVAVMAAIVGCSKDDKETNPDCGIIVTIEKRSDGGVEEGTSGYVCGQAFTDLVNASKAGGNVEGEDILIFYKGQTRAKVKYLVVNNCQGLEFRWIRYEDGKVPQAAIDDVERQGYCYTVEDRTGIEE
jgi:hypothetical protein